MTAPTLATRYLGLELSGPVVASPSAFTGRIDTLRQLEDAGVGAVVLPSLFAEDVLADPRRADRRVELVAQAKAALDVAVVASINAADRGPWLDHAAAMVEAGADALELNLYRVAADPAEDCCSVQDRALRVVGELRSRVNLPLAVKITPFWSALSNLALGLVEAGADGLVLFTLFRAPEIDVDELRLVPQVSESTPDDQRLPLRWTGILRPLLPSTSLAVTGGTHSGRDVLKAIIMGADVACVATAIVKYGPEHVARMIRDVSDWLAENEYDRLDQVRGLMSAEHTPFPGAFERAQYRAMLRTTAPEEAQDDRLRWSGE